MDETARNEMLKALKDCYHETTKKAKDIGQYTDRSFKEAVLANQATLMACLAVILEDMTAPCDQEG